MHPPAQGEGYRYLREPEASGQFELSAGKPDSLAQRTGHRVSGGRLWISRAVVDQVETQIIGFRSQPDRDARCTRMANSVRHGLSNELLSIELKSRRNLCFALFRRELAGDIPLPLML